MNPKELINFLEKPKNQNLNSNNSDHGAQHGAFQPRGHPRPDHPQRPMPTNPRPPGPYSQSGPPSGQQPGQSRPQYPPGSKPRPGPPGKRLHHNTTFKYIFRAAFSHTTTFRVPSGLSTKGAA